MREATKDEHYVLFKEDRCPFCRHDEFKNNGKLGEATIASCNNEDCQAQFRIEPKYIAMILRPSKLVDSSSVADSTGLHNYLRSDIRPPLPVKQITKEQYLLNCLAEECAEVIQRITKALRFGMEEIQGGQLLDNRERLIYEFNDILGVMEVLKEAGVDLSQVGDREQIELKKEKLKKYMALSESRGII